MDLNSRMFCIYCAGENRAFRPRPEILLIFANANASKCLFSFITLFRFQFQYCAQSFSVQGNVYVLSLSLPFSNSCSFFSIAHIFLARSRRLDSYISGKYLFPFAFECNKKSNKKSSFAPPALRGLSSFAFPTHFICGGRKVGVASITFEFSLRSRFLIKVLGEQTDTGLVYLIHGLRLTCRGRRLGIRHLPKNRKPIANLHVRPSS